jgi:GGDEF domain-containing protein
MTQVAKAQRGADWRNAVGDEPSMTHPRFYDASGLLTLEAFRFMVDHQVRHAQRAQEFLTLVVFVAERDWRDLHGVADERSIREIARLIRGAVRNTDLLARTAEGMLSLLLVGIDLERAHAVIDRVRDHLRSYAGASGLRISVGTACVPTHTISSEELLHLAVSRRAAANGGA